MRVVLVLALAAVVAACGGSGERASDERPSVVVTTTILGDVVSEVVGDAARVEVVLPAGADPHEFQPSARQAEALAEADLVVANGAGFEAGLDDLISAAADGATVFAFADHVELLTVAEAGGGEVVDPHLWLDPARMAVAVEALGEQVASLAGVEAADVTGRARSYADAVRALDAEVEALVAGIPPSDASW